MSIDLSCFNDGHGLIIGISAGVESESAKGLLPGDGQSYRTTLPGWQEKA